MDVAQTKLWVYLVAAFGCGLAGALYYLGNLRISPDSAFSVNWTAFSIFIVMLGGMATIEGPIVGVILFYLLSRLFSDYGTWYLVGLGALAASRPRKEDGYLAAAVGLVEAAGIGPVRL